MRLQIFVPASLLLLSSAILAESSIPGIDFTKPGPSPSPSPSPLMKRPPPSARKGRRNLGVGAFGDNQGNQAAEGKVRVGF